MARALRSGRRGRKFKSCLPDLAGRFDLLFLRPQIRRKVSNSGRFPQTGKDNVRNLSADGLGGPPVVGMYSVGEDDDVHPAGRVAYHRSARIAGVAKCGFRGVRALYR